MINPQLIQTPTEAFLPVDQISKRETRSTYQAPIRKSVLNHGIRVFLGVPCVYRITLLINREEMSVKITVRRFLHVLQWFHMGLATPANVASVINNVIQDG